MRSLTRFWGPMMPQNINAPNHSRRQNSDLELLLTWNCCCRVLPSWSFRSYPGKWVQDGTQNEFLISSRTIFEVTSSRGLSEQLAGEPATATATATAWRADVGEPDLGCPAAGETDIAGDPGNPGTDRTGGPAPSVSRVTGLSPHAWIFQLCRTFAFQHCHLKQKTMYNSIQ